MAQQDKNLADEDVVDLEECAKHDRPVPKGKRYRIRIDRERFVVDVSSMSGADILALADKTPQSHILAQRRRGGGTDPVEPTDIVDFTKPGIERFVTLPRDCTEG